MGGLLRVLRAEGDDRPVGEVDINQVPFPCIVPAGVVVAGDGGAAGQFLGGIIDFMDGVFQSLFGGILGEVAVEKLTGVIVQKADAEVGVFGGESALVDCQLLFLQVGELFAPALLLEQGGQPKHGVGIVVQGAVIFVAVVKACAGPDFVPFDEGENCGTKTGGPHY